VVLACVTEVATASAGGLCVGAVGVWALCIRHHRKTTITATSEDSRRE